MVTKEDRGRTALTRLQRFLDANGWTSADLEEKIDPPMQRQTVTRIRAGSNVRLSTMRRIQLAASKLARRPVRIEELWDVDPPHVSDLFDAASGISDQE